jgi:hypothetical protein
VWVEVPTLYVLKNMDRKKPLSIDDWFIIRESSWL